MVAQNTVRTYGINQVFRFIEGIWFHQNGRQIRIFSEKTYFTSCTMVQYKNLTHHLAKIIWARPEWPKNPGMEPVGMILLLDNIPFGIYLW